MKRRRGSYRPAKGRVFTGLMVCSILAMFFPSYWSQRVATAVAPIFFPLAAITRPTALAASKMVVGPGTAGLTPEEIKRILDERDLYRNRTMHYAGQLRGYERRIAELEGLRTQVPAEVGRLVSAAVMQSSPSALMRRLIAARGGADNIREGDLVLSALAVAKGEADGVKEEMNVLAGAGDYDAVARNYLIGRVVAVGRYSSLVQLFSDPASKLAVELPPNAKRKALIDWPVLEGNERGEMVITLQEAYDVQQGEPVYAKGPGGGLPGRLLVGYVTEVAVADQPTMVTLTVKLKIDVRRLDTVYILKPNRDGD